MILHVDEINKSYGSRQVLKSISLSCAKGEVSGLIGPNGAGKSTLFRIIFGLVRPDSGVVSVHSKSQKSLGGFIDKPALYGYLSARDNLKVFARMQKFIFSNERYLELMDLVGLDVLRNDPVKYYSTGMKQRLGLAVSLMNEPECIILDEPFSGLDPFGNQSFKDLILKLARDKKIAVLIASHNLYDMGDLCDVLYIINEGEIIRQGNATELFRMASSSFRIYGELFAQSNTLRLLGAEITEGSVLVKTGNMNIEEVIKSIVSEGCSVSACIPQTSLEVLLQKELP
ncbi:MAG: ABC transporter ATP-binding protein [Flavobacteriaceae bacterium]